MAMVMTGFTFHFDHLTCESAEQVQEGGNKTSCYLPACIHHLEGWMERHPCIPAHNSSWGTGKVLTMVSFLTVLLLLKNILWGIFGCSHPSLLLLWLWPSDLQTVVTNSEAFKWMGKENLSASVLLLVFISILDILMWQTCFFFIG